jgi:hypothetical protein
MHSVCVLGAMVLTRGLDFVFHAHSLLTTLMWKHGWKVENLKCWMGLSFSLFVLGYLMSVKDLIPAYMQKLNELHFRISFYLLLLMKKNYKA